MVTNRACTNLVAIAFLLSLCGCQGWPKTCGGNDQNWAEHHYFVVVADGCKTPKNYLANTAEEANDCAANDGAIPGGQARDIPWCDGEEPTSSFLWDTYGADAGDDSEGGTITCSGADAGVNARTFDVFIFNRDGHCLVETRQVFANSAAEAKNCVSNGLVEAFVRTDLCKFALTWCYCLAGAEQSGAEEVLARDSASARECLEWEFEGIENFTVIDVTSDVSPTGSCLATDDVAWYIGMGSWPRPSCFCGD